MYHDSQTAINYLDGIFAAGNQIQRFQDSTEGESEWASIGYYLQNHPSKNKE